MAINLAWVERVSDLKAENGRARDLIAESKAVRRSITIDCNVIVAEAVEEVRVTKDDVLRSSQRSDCDYTLVRHFYLDE